MRDIKTLIGMLEDLKTKLKKYKEDDSGTYSFYEDLQYHLNSILVELPVMQKIAEYVEEHYKIEWDKMGNTGEDGYWDTATRDEIYHFGRFRAFEDLQSFMEGNFSA